MSQANPQQTIRLLEPSFKSLLIQLIARERIIASATAILCLSRAGPVLVTNRHNLTGRHIETDVVLSPTGAVPDTVRIHHNRADALGQWVIREEPLYLDEEPRWREHPRLGSKVDVVALPLASLQDVAPRAYDLEATGPSILVMPSDIVSVVGFPFGLTGGGSLAIWATGFVATEPSVDYSNLPIFLIDCRSRQGQSGSPVIAHRNGGLVALENGSSAGFAGPVTRFLGLYSGRVNKQSDLGFVWKIGCLRDVVASV